VTSVTGEAEALVDVLRYVLVATMAVAGFAKLASPHELTPLLNEVRLPDRFQRYVIVGIPLAEIGIAAALILRPMFGAAAAFGLLSMFTAVALALVLARRHVSCACFGSLSEGGITWMTIVRNTTLTCIAAWILAMPETAFSLPHLLTGSLVFVVAFLVTNVKQVAFRSDREVLEAVEP